MALTPDRLREWTPAGSHVIDIGCGKGRLVRALADHAGWVIGVDYYEPHIQIARSIPHPDNVTFKVADARSLDAERYDAALLIHVLEPIDDPVELLSELKHVSPLLIVEVPAFDRDVLNVVRWRMGLDFSSDSDHVREYTQPMLADQLCAAGWHPLEWCRGPMSIGTLAARSRDAR